MLIVGSAFGQSSMTYDNSTHKVRKPPASTNSGGVDYDFTDLNIAAFGGSTASLTSLASLVGTPGLTSIPYMDDTAHWMFLSAGTGVRFVSGQIEAYKTLITERTEDTAPTEDDFILTLDSSFQALRKVTLQNFASQLTIDNVTDPTSGFAETFDASLLTADHSVAFADGESVTVLPSSALGFQFATGITSGGVITYGLPQNHAVYAPGSPPTVDVGTFEIGPITGVDLKNAGTTTIFTVPTGRKFVCVGATAIVTAVTGGGAGTETFKITESGAGGSMTQNTASGSATPVVGNYYREDSPANTGPYTMCAAGNLVQIVVSTSQAGSTTVTGSVFIRGFYAQ